MYHWIREINTTYFDGKSKQQIINLLNDPSSGVFVESDNFFENCFKVISNLAVTKYLKTTFVCICCEIKPEDLTLMQMIDDWKTFKINKNYVLKEKSIKSFWYYIYDPKKKEKEEIVTSDDVLDYIGLNTLLSFTELYRLFGIYSNGDLTLAEYMRRNNIEDLLLIRLLIDKLKSIGVNNENITLLNNIINYIIGGRVVDNSEAKCLLDKQYSVDMYYFIYIRLEGIASNICREIDDNSIGYNWSKYLLKIAQLYCKAYDKLRNTPDLFRFDDEKCIIDNDDDPLLQCCKRYINHFNIMETGLSFLMTLLTHDEETKNNYIKTGKLKQLIGEILDYTTKYLAHHKSTICAEKKYKKSNLLLIINGLCSMGVIQSSYNKLVSDIKFDKVYLCEEVKKIDVDYYAKNANKYLKMLFELDVTLLGFSYRCNMLNTLQEYLPNPDFTDQFLHYLNIAFELNHLEKKHQLENHPKTKKTNIYLNKYGMFFNKNYLDIKVICDYSNKLQPEI